MKKLSLLAVLGMLTACNDGGTPSGAYGRPTDMRPGRNPFVNTAKESNAQITGMISSNAAQVASYMDYRLNGYTGTKTPNNYADVAEMAINLATMNTDEIENQFETNKDILFQAMYVLNHNLGTCAGDTGAIVAECINTWRNANQGAINAAINSLRANGELLSINDAEFIAPDASLTFSINESGEITGLTIDNGETQNVFNRNGDIFVNNTETLSYNSGADSNLVLSYSDFGVYQIQTGDEITRNIPFAGGYDQKRIATTDIGTDLEFSGVAVGTVSNATDNLDVRDDRASLTFNHETGDSTLTATFANWYKITVNQNIDATDTNIGFSNYQGTDEFKLPDGVDNAPANMNIGYYGANPSTGTPSEATGLVQYKNDASGINMDVAFGARK